MDRIITVFKKDEWAFEKLKEKWYFINPFCERFRIKDKALILKLDAVKRDNIYDDNEIVQQTLREVLKSKTLGA